MLVRFLLYALIFFTIFPVKAADQLEMINKGVFQSMAGNKNPWTHLQFDANKENFQFVIVSDRTAGHRPGIFASAMRKINYLRPEFVVSVGDLVEGIFMAPNYAAEWQAFNRQVEILKAPFFYVPGNHDLTNRYMVREYLNRFGRTTFSFTYKQDLFIILNTEEYLGKLGNEGAKVGEPIISKEQLTQFRQILANYPNVRWTYILMHQPIWLESYKKSNWKDIEVVLGDRKRVSVFAGHTNLYSKTLLNGRTLYNLSVTGASFTGEREPPSGILKGNFDHIVWVTATENGPTISNLLLSGIFGDDPKEEINREGLPLVYENFGDKRAIQMRLNAERKKAAEESKDAMLEIVRNSTSWRVTAPLRWIKCWVAFGRSCAKGQR